MTRIAEVMIDWLLQAAVATRDAQSAPAVSGYPEWVAVSTGVAMILLSLAILGTMLVLLPMAWRLRDLERRARAVLDRLGTEIAPLAQHATRIADNVDYLTTAVREDVRQLSRTANLVDERVRAAMARAELRLREFDALLRVARDEAEDALLATAATLRGVRAGAMRLGRSRGRPYEEEDVEDALADDLLDEEDDIDEDVVDLVDDDDDEIDELDREELEEMDDGDDRTTAGHRTGPRIKRTRRGPAA